MAKYKIIPSSRTIVQSPISIGHKAEKGVEAIEFDLTAWVETYGSGTLTVIMRRWGDAIPYPIALEIDENNKATWTLSDIDTARAGMAYAQLNYIVGDEVVKKSDIYTFRVMDSLTGEGEPPEAYESWLEHLTHLAAEAMAEVLDIEGIVTDKTLTVDGGIADAKATGDALSALEDQFTEETDQLKADLDASKDLTIEQIGNVFAWESGTFNSRGVDVENPARARNKGYIPCKYYKSVNASNDVEIVIGLFDSSGTMLGYYNGASIGTSATWVDYADLADAGSNFMRIIARLKQSPTDNINPTICPGAISYTSKIVSEINSLSTVTAESTAKLAAVSSESAVGFTGGNLNADSTPKIIQNEGYVSITFPCKTGRTYKVTREYGNRFLVACTSQEPVNRVPCEKVVADSTLNSYSFIPPAGAKYVIVNLQNDMAGASSHTHEEIIASCAVYTYSAVDSNAREASAEVAANYEQLVADANNSEYWAIMGLGSAGENNASRNWNISSDTYLSNIISVTTDDGYATRYVLYNSDKSFIYRSGFYREEISISSLMEEYSATYVRFEVQALDESGAEITTPIDNVSRYAHVHLYVLRDSGIKVDGASKKWYEDSLVQSTYLDRIKQAKYVYANTDSGETPHPVLTLLHFSDVHGNADAMLYALAINDIFANDIDDMLHTGDVVTKNLSDGISNWISSGCANKVLNVIGNHDTEENLVLQAAGKDNVYNTIFAPYITQWGVTQPTGVNTSGSDNYHALYYYKDYSAAEVRLIVLDTNFWDTAQKSWLTSILADAKTNGLCVVIACHDVKLLTEMTESNFSSYNGDGITETRNSYANQPSNWLDPVDDFINGGGNFACILAGHNHDGHMGTMTNYPNIFVYVSDKAGASRVSGAARITGEMNANAVSVVVINPVEKLFKIVKIGAQIDGKMRPQNVFCYDYANKRIISQW